MFDNRNTVFNYLFALVAAVAMIFVASISLASPAQAATIDLTWAVDLVGSYLMEMLAIAVASLAGFISSRISKLTGVQIDAGQREALHAALERGIGFAIDQLSRRIEGEAKFEVDNEFTAEVFRYVEKHTPGALNHFKLTPEDVGTLVRAKVGGDLIAAGDFDFGTPTG